MIEVHEPRREVCDSEGRPPTGTDESGKPLKGIGCPATKKKEKTEQRFFSSRIYIDVGKSRIPRGLREGIH